MTSAESLNPDESIWNLMAYHLRFERQRRHLSQSEMGSILGVNKSGVSNLEAGRNRLTQDQARRVDHHWNTGGLYERLRGFAVLLGRDEGWDKQLRDFESGALNIKIYYGRVIPVPLQTEDYARFLIIAGRQVPNVDTAVKIRMARQAMLLEQLPKMALWVLIDERVLHEMDDGEMKQAQLAHLLDLSEHLSLRIVPDKAHTHIGVDGEFELITTAAGIDVAYVWAQLGGRLIHDPVEVRSLGMRYDRIGARALSEDESRTLIRRILEGTHGREVAEEQ
ncbi:helix-turn-helix domain-containing protein [Actinomadura parmotrematis]|uniref:Helix-turn-helix transcriptional regulator n=1 Tax=Actinomadura parmotrematis TaxID=2864039 RepID=A0ABS7G4J8_9ACTN|nr:helix-turn-helix transcriptional regulator [Actinomadura parmotrematis]MBW8487300.1 helix-turn-helix transcriptional regulator [Actinomadura parmotrematis]